MKNEKHECAPENAANMRTWIEKRGGIAIWPSVNLSNPGASWSTPANTLEGTPTPKPTWQAADKPERVITDPNEVVVVTRKEVKRFHVALRRSGLAFKCTEASSRRIKAAVAKAGEGASYEFDQGSQEAIITVPGETVSLAAWKP